MHAAMNAKLGNEICSIFNVLIVDDDHTSRIILESQLTKQGCNVYTAANGKEAVDQYSKHFPDLVVMDILMPVMDGFEATRHILELAKGHFVKVMFITALSDYEQLKRCIDVGGDDFLIKPYNSAILEAKVHAYRSMRDTESLLQRQKIELRAHEEQNYREQEVAKRVFDNIAHTGCLEHDNIDYVLSPKSVFNGDLLLASYSPSGILHVMIGDFTGHGLPAAIGAIPTSEIFYSMTKKGFSLQEVICEINEKLNYVLPSGFFCVACFLEIDLREKRVGYYNCGIPGSILFRECDKSVVSMEPTNIPLGILNKPDYNVIMQYKTIQNGDRVFLYSDGIIESSNSQGEMFKQERIDMLFERHDNSSDIYHALIDTHQKFLGSAEPDDDITLLHILIDEHLLNEPQLRKNNATVYKEEINWSFQYRFEISFLKYHDPLPLVLNSIMQTFATENHRNKIYTILAELYSNALDHGLLGLDSQIKDCEGGFKSYYEAREARLTKLIEGDIVIDVSIHSDAVGGRLSLSVEDSGGGFEPHIDQRLIKTSSDQHGRGVALIRALCRSVTYNSRGNRVNVVYEWSL